MIVTVCRNLSDRCLTDNVEPGKLSDIFDQLGLDSAVALVNGKLAEPETEVTKDDIVFIRQVPKGLLVGLAVFAGVLLVAGAAYAGYQIYKMRAQMEKYKDGLSGVGDQVTNIPYLKGAKNVRALDRHIPFIIGGGRIAPYVLSDGRLAYPSERRIERDTPYVLGYGDLVLRECLAKDATIKTFTGDTPHEGLYDLDASAADFLPGASLYISQDTVPARWYNPALRETYSIDEPGEQILRKGNTNYKDLVYTLPENVSGCEVALLFRGLGKYNSKGDFKRHECLFRMEYTLNGTTWLSFPSRAGRTLIVERATKYEFRVTASFSLPYATVKNIDRPIQIKIICLSEAYTGAGAFEEVYVQSISSKKYDPNASATANNYVFVPPLDTTLGAKCCKALLSSSKAQKGEADALTEIHFIVDGVAKTWNGTIWSATKTPTKNPASWLLEILTSDVHPQSKINESDIDLEAFGELYDYCVAEDIEVSKVLLDGAPKEKTIQMICDLCYSTLYKNLDGKISVATDKEKENAIAVINTQNCFSFSNKKDMSPRVDGLRVTFVNEDKGYESDAYEVMRPGVTKDANSRIRALTADGITRYEQIVRHAWRMMAIEAARPKVTAVEVGHEGVYYTPLSKVLVQHPSLKNGLGSAEIKSVVMSGDYITGLDLYEAVQYEAADSDGFGVVIQCVSDTYCTPLAKAYDYPVDGYITSIEFVEPIDTTTAEVIPRAGDTLSYGYLNAGEFDTITSPMLITNMAQTDRGWRLELVDYNPAIYEYGEVPEYIPNITSKMPTTAIPSAPPALSSNDMVEVVRDSQNPITVSGVPVFEDRETCIAECTLDDVHYLLYQDLSAGTENWEIVTINEDLSFTSFLTGSGVLNDMCVHDDRIFLSSDDGLSYIDDGELVQVYDEGVDSIQSDNTDLYCVKDGEFCRFSGAPVFLPINTVLIYCAAMKDDVIYVISEVAGVGPRFGIMDSDGFTQVDLLYEGSPIVPRFGAHVLLIHKNELVIIIITEGSSRAFQIDGTTATLLYTFPNRPISTTTDGTNLYCWLSSCDTIKVKEDYSGYDVVAVGPSCSTMDGSLIVYKGVLVKIRTITETETWIIASLQGNEFVDTLVLEGFSSTNVRQKACVIENRLFLTAGLSTGKTVEISGDLSAFSVVEEYGNTIQMLIYDGVNSFARQYSVEADFSLVCVYSGLSSPLPIDETVRNYGKLRLLGDTLHLAETDGDIYRFDGSDLLPVTTSGTGFNALTQRLTKNYAAKDSQVYEFAADGTLTAVENATSATPIIELFDYVDYLVWCPTYTPPATGTLYAAFVNFTGNVNVYQNITLTLPSDFPIGAVKTFRKMTDWNGFPVAIAAHSGATIEGQSEVWLYGKYDYYNIERVSSSMYVIADRNMPALDLDDDFDALEGFPVRSRITIRKSSAYSSAGITITPPSGATFEGLASIDLYGQYSFVELERISSTVFAIKDLQDTPPLGVEQVTNEKWVDGKRIWKKIIYFGALPDTAQKTVSHGITFENLVAVSGIAIDGTVSLPVPYATSTSFTSNIQAGFSTSSIVVTVGTNRSTYSAIFTMKYTKT